MTEIFQRKYIGPWETLGKLKETLNTYQKDENPQRGLEWMESKNNFSEVSQTGLAA